MTTTRFTLILPTELNDWLIEQARLHNRSKTQEIVNILELAQRRAVVNKANGQDEQRMAMKGD